MSADVSTTAVPGTTTVTIATANEALPIAIPRCAYVTVQFKVNAGMVAWSGTEGVTLGDAAIDQAAGQAVAWPVHGPTRAGDGYGASAAPILYVQTAVAGTVVALQFSRGD